MRSFLRYKALMKMDKTTAQTVVFVLFVTRAKLSGQRGLQSILSKITYKQFIAGKYSENVTLHLLSKSPLIII